MTSVLVACDLFVIFVCDRFVISRKVYKKKISDLPLEKTLINPEGPGRIRSNTSGWDKNCVECT